MKLCVRHLGFTFLAPPVRWLSIGANFDDLEGHLEVISVQLTRRAVSKQ